MGADLADDSTSRSLPLPEPARKVLEAAKLELAGLHPRLLAVQLLLSPLPVFVGSRTRGLGLRLAGCQIGHGTLLWGLPRLTGNGDICKRLVIGSRCQINLGCTFDLEDRITIGDRVGIGHEVLILTSTHKIGPRVGRSGELQTAPVVIEEGAWIGARCTILPGVTIGAGSVIGAGTVVNRDVPPDTLITGTQRLSLARWR